MDRVKRQYWVDPDAHAPKSRPNPRHILQAVLEPADYLELLSPETVQRLHMVMERVRREAMEGRKVMESELPPYCQAVGPNYQVQIMVSGKSYLGKPMPTVPEAYESFIARHPGLHGELAKRIKNRGHDLAGLLER